MTSVLTRFKTVMGFTTASKMPLVFNGERRELVERVRNKACAVGLQELFEDSSFSICQLRDCCKAARIVPDGDVMEILSPLHCVKWEKMPRDLREEVAQLIVSMFADAEESIP